MAIRLRRVSGMLKRRLMIYTWMTNSIQNRPPRFYVGDKVELSISSTSIITTITTIDVFRGKYYYNVADVGAKWPESMLRSVSDGS
jgi:hypothetical protein